LQTISDTSLNSFQLDNKLKVIYAIDKSNPLISLQLYVRMGSCWERDNEAGYSHLTEHLVFKSTRKFPNNQLMEQISWLGGSINAYTEFDSTCYYITIPKDYFSQALEALSELVRYANYSDKEFISERGVVIEEQKQYQNDPEDYFLEEIPKYYFQQIPYRKPIIGTLASLKAATPNDLRLFYQHYYTPDNCFLVVCGDFDLTSLQENVEFHFGDWSHQCVDKVPLVTEDYPTQLRTKYISKNGKSPILAFVFPELSESVSDSYGLSLVSKAFSVGKNSRLYKRLYTDDKLVDQIKVHSLSGLHDGIAIILVMPKKGVELSRIYYSFFDELSKLQRHGLTVEEIQKQKRELANSYRYSYEYIENLGMTLASEELIGDYREMLHYVEKVNALTKQDTDRLIEKYYATECLMLFQQSQRKAEFDEILSKVPIVANGYDNPLTSVDYQELKLSNGMKLMMKKVVGKPTIGINLALPISHLCESIEHRGVNALTASSLLYGTEKKSYDQFLEFCLDLGMSFSISAEAESTSIRVKCFQEMLDTALGLLAEVFEKPAFPDDHIKNLKATWISNLNRMKEYPQQYAPRLWKEQLLGKKSNLVSREGGIASLKKVSRKQILDWYRQYYGCIGATISIVGDFDFSKAIELVSQLFRRRQESVTPPCRLLHLEETLPSMKRKKTDEDQSIIFIGGFGCHGNDTIHNTGFHVLAQIIGGEINSRMFNVLREEKGLAYSVGFDFQSIRDLGFFSATAIVDKTQEQESVEAIVAILRSIREEGVTQKELETAKNYIRGARLMDEESVLAQAQIISTLEIMGYDYQYYLNRDQRLLQVDAALLKGLAERYFHEDQLYTLIMS